ncbi:hypothetical protein B9Z45_08170 [Limnohabitans sp. 2KL-17]|uniref:hypothetical protein n=1 Tax=Limnohabitans sp. 2KL-17 TaxID=1100704 RepID=UPI000D39EAD6|nr:hypothetical protein [Limnohabitans sp. 2KL-17]PUE57383.1 hypothetical protein B9Z45_08170 [Limnohabitans sp. 2KL-17]
MAWLDFLKNGNELSELLIEGANPYGSSLLKQADVDQMRDHIQPPERVLAYVLGRVVLAGRGLWLLTDQQLLISEHDSGSLVHHFDLSDITEAECVKGKYGYTLRVTAAGQLRSVYGASAHMAAVFYRALGQKVRCTPVYKPTALNADDVAEVVHHFCDAALRLQPVAMVNADARALIDQLAQDAANQGWLMATEATQVRQAEAAH